MAELELQRADEALSRALESREAVTLICYTPFGIVKGTVNRSTDVTQSHIAIKQADHVLKLHDAVVEHYSSHLPTGIYKVFFLSLKKVSGYVLIEA